MTAPLKQMHEKIVAVIPARAGSKGLVGKNIKMLDGLPLYQHAVNQALAAKVSAVLISTDCPVILAASHPPGVRAIERPMDLSGDTTPMSDVLKHLVADHITHDCTMVLLQPTSPLRQPDHILEAINLYRAGTFDLVVSAVEIDRSILKAGMMSNGRYVPINRAEYVFANRQSLPPVYKHNGAIYVFDRAWLSKNQNFETDRIGLYEMSSEDSADIDTAADFERCEALMKLRNA